MRSECEILVDLDILREAVDLVGRENENAVVWLTPASDEEITVDAFPGSITIPMVGRWRYRVGVDHWRLAAVIYRIEEPANVRLLFAGSMLFVNGTGFSAWRVRPSALEPAGQGWQAMLPGMEPVTPSERLRYRVEQPLRPRIRQRSMIGTSLFGRPTA